VNAIPTAESVVLAATTASRRRIGQRCRALGAIRPSHCIRRFALGASDFFSDLLAIQILLDFTSREVTIVHVFGQVYLEQLEEPALLLR
jgi:hypothetical protein